MKPELMFRDSRFMAFLESKDKALLRRIIIKNDPDYTKKQHNKLNRIKELYRRYKKHGRV